MTSTQLLLCIAMSIGGQLLDLLLIQIPDLRKTAKAANKPFTLKEWWQRDWNVILATQVIIIMVTIGWDEIVGWKPGADNYMKWIYAGVGGFGSSIAMAKWGNYKRTTTELFSLKSNISDAVTGGTTTVHETIVKGEMAVGQDISNPGPEKK